MSGSAGNGFTEEWKTLDFPVRDHKTILHINDTDSPWTAQRHTASRLHKDNRLYKEVWLFTSIN